MKLTNNFYLGNKFMIYADLKPGEVFDMHGRKFMKCQDASGLVFPDFAVDMSTGTFVEVQKDQVVMRLSDVTLLVGYRLAPSETQA